MPALCEAQVAPGVRCVAFAVEGETRCAVHRRYTNAGMRSTCPTCLKPIKPGDKIATSSSGGRPIHGRCVGKTPVVGG